MNSNKPRTSLLLVIAAGVLCLAFAISMSAQVQTQTTTDANGQPITTTTVERGEVVYVSGNQLVVKMADGSIRHFDHVPDSVRITVGDQQLGVHDLKVGMKLQRTITTTETAKVVKTVKSVTGTVWNVMPPSSVILTMENGKNQQFKIPEGQQFNINGQVVDAWGLKKGMRVSATKVVEAPETEVVRQTKLTGVAPPPPPPPPPDVPIIVVEEVAVPVEVAAAPAPVLPKTASPLPLLGLLGFVSLASSLGLKAFRMK